MGICCVIRNESHPLEKDNGSNEKKVDSIILDRPNSRTRKSVINPALVTEQQFKPLDDKMIRRIYKKAKKGEPPLECK